MVGVWPSSPFPQSPLVRGYDETAPNTSIRTSMDQGPAKVRRRFTAGVRPVSWPFLLTLADITTLDDFYVTTLESGTITFTHTDPRTGSSTTYRFVKEPTYSRNGLYFNVKISLEILP